MRAPARMALLAVVPLSLVLVAAAPEVAGPKPFSHKLHVGEQEMPCKSCHDLKAEGLPALKSKGCGKCHEDGAPQWRKKEAAPGQAKVRFPHSKHAEKGECADCHQSVLEDQQPAPLEAESCGRCHEEKKVAVNELACAQCHGEDLKRRRPADHDGAWFQRHGEQSQWRALEEHGKSCGDCHRPATCSACHDQQKPRDHNGLWRVRTHGLAAGWDRDRCMTCHQTSTCQRCHADTRPVNHAGNWRLNHGLVAGTVGNETCNVCHQTSWCAACHSGR
ncbi:MAG: cytochrome c3 family protein [Deltaproteobacteria bacterium]|nr:cytochrome c3 family protein [Deltaproteobacteria bacterium]